MELWGDVIRLLQLLSFIVIAIAYNNCMDAPFSSNEEAFLSINSTNPNPQAGQLRFLKAKEVLDKHCVSCHSPNGSAGFTRFDYDHESQFLSAGLFIPQDINKSKVLIRTIFYNGSLQTSRNMPTENTTHFSQEDHDVLVDWVANYEAPDQFVDQELFICKTNQKNPESILMRLTKQQYINTIRDLPLNLSSAERHSLMQSLQSALDEIPEDTDNKMKRFDNRLTPQHLAAQYKVATQFADYFVNNSNLLGKLSTNCMAQAPPPDSCVQSFIQNFGLRVLRRPLKRLEAADFFSFYKQQATTGTQDLITKLLITPQFLYHIQNEGPIDPNDPQQTNLTSYEIASKLSYQYWNTMPDKILFTTAAQGALTTVTGREQAIQYVFSPVHQSKLQSTLNSFLSQFLHLDKVPIINSQQTAAFSNFSIGLGTDSHDYRTDMLDEVYGIFDYITFKALGSYEDILTTNISVTQSDELANLYNIPKWDGSSSPPRFPASERGGLLNRAALLLSGTEKTSPIHRGAKIRQEILCDTLPAPPDDALDNVPTVDVLGSTTRENVGIITQADSCNSCHSKFNGFGYNLETYDSLGRNRIGNFEKIFDINGNFYQQLKTDTTSQIEINYGHTQQISDGVHLSQVLAKNDKPYACFAKSYYRYSKRRMNDEINRSDDCQMEFLYNSLRNSKGGILEMYKSFARDPSFTVRRFGP